MLSTSGDSSGVFHIANTAMSVRSVQFYSTIAQCMHLSLLVKIQTAHRHDTFLKS